MSTSTARTCTTGTLTHDRRRKTPAIPAARITTQRIVLRNQRRGALISALLEPTIRGMRSVGIALALTLALSSLAVAVRAEEKRASPHDQASAAIAGKKVTIQYGRPYKKGRPIFGALVPYGQVWRTGADEATTLTTDGDLMIGTLRVPKGSYALFTVPGKNEWTLVINKTAQQWGAFSYDAKDDLGRVPMKLGASAAPIEQFTIELEPAGARKATLKLSWDKLVASVPVAAP
jgi:hypothetical protein